MPKPDNVGVGVAIALLRGRNVLMGMRKGSHASGVWSFPGGWIDSTDNSFHETCVRELLEETGIQIIGRLFRLGETLEFHEPENLRTVTLCFWTREFEGEPALLEPHKCEGWVWIPVDCPPENLFPGITSVWTALGLASREPTGGQ